jgi:hypothetical protein
VLCVGMVKTGVVCPWNLTDGFVHQREDGSLRESIRSGTIRR